MEVLEQTEHFTLKKGRISYELTVKANGREMTVIIPYTGDSQWDSYIIEGEKEKTLNSLIKKQPKPVLSVPKREEAAGALREFQRDCMRRRENTRGKLHF